MAFRPRQTYVPAGVKTLVRDIAARVEKWLEIEREQAALWVPVALGVGIAAWFMLPDRNAWLGFACGSLALVFCGVMLPAGMRLRHMIVAGGLLACMGCLLVWGKAMLVGEPPLARAIFSQVSGEVRSVSEIPAQGIVRVLLRPVGDPALPSTIRVNIATADVPKGLGKGALIRFRVRLMPPAPANVPGGYDFARRAYFLGIGATGKALKPVVVLRAATVGPSLRARLLAHIRERIDGPPAGIAMALATGDQGSISQADANAMRRSGLAHLLSISGLHVTALIGAVIFLLLRVMAISRQATLGLPLMMIAAAGGALAGIGYTLLTGAEVPTVRSCVAALLVLAGLALGRDAITLRLVAAGALVVLALWPDALVGPSFQMSFAAVIAIVALGEHPRYRAFVAARDESVSRRIGRALLALLATGFAVELVLAPIALFHFHKAGLLGAFANLIAIPLTTFVVMPLEALALLLDIAGLGAPVWWLTGQALRLLLFIAHSVAASPMAVMLAPATSPWLYGIMVMGGLWVLLWRTSLRWLGLLAILPGLIAIFTASPPDILVTGDGGHVAVRTAGGGMAILRDRAGDYVRDSLSESAGFDGALAAIAALPEARCSADMCALRMVAGGRPWRILVTRSDMLVDRAAMERDCAAADIVLSNRRLPNWCRARWLKADRALLRRTGGIAINLESATIQTVRSPGDAHPWVPVPPRSRPPYQLYRRSSPASLP
ncbi:ComEC/Rec2 family competence protein [Sphingobium sp. AN558]|uniref:ComEC/Rec2 family competence protein n=1 Tax=Sphingobium sp. AN558 TaxID=3133442 RepID=UPI0030C42154